MWWSKPYDARLSKDCCYLIQNKDSGEELVIPRGGTMILSDVSIDIDQVECSAKYASHWHYVQDTPSCPCDVWLSVINQLSSSSSILLRFASNDGWIAPVVFIPLNRFHALPSSRNRNGKLVLYSRQRISSVQFFPCYATLWCILPAITSYRQVSWLSDSRW